MELRPWSTPAERYLPLAVAAVLFDQATADQCTSGRRGNWRRWIVVKCVIASADYLALAQNDSAHVVLSEEFGHALSNGEN